MKEYKFDDKTRGTTTETTTNINQQYGAANNSNQTSQKYDKPTIGGVLTSPYGDRNHPIYKTNRPHDGIDIAGLPLGTPIHAAQDGKVTYVGWVKGYGNYVSIEHINSNGDKIITFYGHLNDFKTQNGTNLKVGQVVKKGEQIGSLGNTGDSTNPHVHFGAKKNGKKINPVEIIGDVYPKIKK